MSGQALPFHRFSIGLTGGIGSGKTTVADMFAARGAAVIDTDLIAHQLTTAGGAAIPEIQAQFGADFLTSQGAMDRAKMRATVFDEPSAKARLEAILHPLIRVETERAAEQAQGAYLIFVVPLLVESGSWKERVSRVLVVDCAEQTQVRRVISRSGLPESQVRAIMAAQVPRQQRLAAADDVISNENGMDDLVPQVERLHALYASLAAKKT
jgi:dephospho-CoA kinase